MERDVAWDDPLRPVRETRPRRRLEHSVAAKRKPALSPPWKTSNETQPPLKRGRGSDVHLPQLRGLEACACGMLKACISQGDHTHRECARTVEAARGRCELAASTEAEAEQGLCVTSALTSAACRLGAPPGLEVFARRADSGSLSAYDGVLLVAQRAWRSGLESGVEISDDLALDDALVHAVLESEANAIFEAARQTAEDEAMLSEACAWDLLHQVEDHHATSPN